MSQVWTCHVYMFTTVNGAIGHSLCVTGVDVSCVYVYHSEWRYRTLSLCHRPERTLSLCHRSERTGCVGPPGRRSGPRRLRPHSAQAEARAHELQAPPATHHEELLCPQPQPGRQGPEAAGTKDGTVQASSSGRLFVTLMRT